MRLLEGKKGGARGLFYSLALMDEMTLVNYRTR